MAEHTMVAELQQVPGVAADGESASQAATYLKIAVLRQGQPIVQVSVPAHAIFNLADLVPGEARSRVRDHHLDLEHIASNCAARGCPAGELFTLPGPDTVVRAWLE